MKSLFLNKIFLSILFFVLGGLSVLGFTHYQKSRAPISSQQGDSDQFFDQFFNSDFFDKSKDPFAEMQRMQNEMEKQFDNKNPFDNWYQKRFGGGDLGEIKQREDNKFVYYDIDIHGQTPKDVKVNVADGQVDISGSTERKKEDKNNSSYYSSSFQRSFPVPSGVDAENFKMEQDGNKIVIKFPKKTI